MKRIVSRDNPHFKALRKLAASVRERRQTGRILLDGLHLIESYSVRYGTPETLWLSEAGCGKDEIVRFLKNHGVAGSDRVLANALFKEISTVDTPSGIMAVAPQPTGRCAVDPQADAVLLDGVQDPGNLGSILRSAAASGFRQILLSGDCAGAWSPKTLRAAMGAHFMLDIHEGVELPVFLRGYRGRCVAAALDGALSLYAFDLAQPVAWLFGSEGQGIRPELAALADVKIRIPMPGETESLNVAAAAAVCLFETVRQRLRPAA